MDPKRKKNLGAKLRKLRKHHKLTQQQLALKITGGLDYTYIGKIERGVQSPSLNVLEKISNALSVPVEFFFQDSKILDELEILPDELRAITRDEHKKHFFKEIKDIPTEDIPLLTEIIRVLKRQRDLKTVGIINSQLSGVPVVAEKRKPYGRAKADEDISDLINQLEQFLVPGQKTFSLKDVELRSALKKAIIILKRSY